MIGLLGKKLGMTQIFDGEGRQKAVTVLEVGPCTVLQLKKKETDGYQAVQLGFEDKKETRSIKAELGHAKKAGTSAKRFIREIRTDSLEGLQQGTILKVNNFAIGDLIDVTGISIGKGFQGVVKRHGFKGSHSMSHGQMMGRQPGSIGSNTDPGRVLKGVKMAGHMGNELITTQNIRVLKIDLENNLMAVNGSVPGHENSYIIIREAVKKRRIRTWKMPDAPVEELKFENKQAPSKKAKAAAAKAAAAKKPAAAPAKGK